MRVAVTTMVDSSEELSLHARGATLKPHEMAASNRPQDSRISISRVLRRMAADISNFPGIVITMPFELNLPGPR
jgi:hypothetical protein